MKSYMFYKINIKILCNKFRKYNKYWGPQPNRQIRKEAQYMIDYFVIRFKKPCKKMISFKTICPSIIDYKDYVAINCDCQNNYDNL